MDTIISSYTYTLGQEGEDSDPDNPLIKSVNYLFNTGKPFKKLLKLLYIDPENNISYWIGIMLLTAANRILFFPGFNIAAKTIHGRWGKKSFERLFPIDHLTLESNFERWHITSSEPKNYLGNKKDNPHTLDLGSGSYFWFALGVAKKEMLKKVYKVTKIEAKSPSSDSKRRAKVLMAATEDVVDGGIIFPKEFEKKVPAPNFLCFNFIVHKNHREMFLFNDYSLCFYEESYKPLENSNLKGLHYKSLITDLSAEITIQTSTVFIPGKTSAPIFISNDLRKNNLTNEN